MRCRRTKPLVKSSWLVSKRNVWIWKTTRNILASTAYPHWRQILVIGLSKVLLIRHRNIYTISSDTKVISKLIELMLFPLFTQFAHECGYELHLTEHQNYYPDITFVAKDGTKIALDLKSTYRVSQTRVSGFTLGAFTGYFRQRTSTKNISFPYQEYSQHFVLGGYLLTESKLQLMSDRYINLKI